MSEATLSPSQCEYLSHYVSDVLGLYFPPSRWADLQRGIAASTKALGYGHDINACALWLMTRPILKQAHVDELSRHLTVGETYFFRETGHFELLAQHIIPQVLRAHEPHNGQKRHIRIWSAACCTGEEPYSLAICLHRMFPQLGDCHVSIVGSDINTDFLQRAAAGIFGKWSFREAPPWLANYFRPLDDGRFEILPQIRNMVTFVPFNLVQDTSPCPMDPFARFDVVFCRNVLMYFSGAQAQKVLQRICDFQANGGWLVVGASELMHVAASPYTPVHVNGKVIHRKQSPSATPATAPADSLTRLVKSLPPQARASMPIVIPLGFPHKPPVSGKRPPAARDLANEGKLSEALAACEASLRGDALNPSHHYLRGLILKEQGNPRAAAQSLARALYLDPTLIVAHVALGHLSLERNRTRAARRHFASAVELLHALNHQQILPESDGMTVRRCLEMIDALSRTEVTA